MNDITEKTDLIILRSTRQEDLDYVIDSEHQPDHAQYVGQWTKEQHINSLFQKDILHLIVIGYGLMLDRRMKEHITFIDPKALSKKVP